MNFSQDPHRETLKGQSYVKKGDKKRQNFDSQPKFCQYGLFYEKSYQNTRTQSPFVQLFVADNMKNNGNRLFKLNNFSEALLFYYKALAIFRFIECISWDWEKKGIRDDKLNYHDNIASMLKTLGNRLKILLLSLFLNIAACSLKQKDFKECIDSCNEALVIDPNNPKAYYRRGLARKSMKYLTFGDYKNVVRDFRTALKLSPDDTAIITILKKSAVECREVTGQCIEEEILREPISAEFAKERSLNEKQSTVPQAMELHSKEKETEETELEEDYEVESPLRKHDKKLRGSGSKGSQNMDKLKEEVDVDELLSIKKQLELKDKLELEGEDKEAVFSDIIKGLIEKEKRQAEILQKLLSDNDQLEQTKAFVDQISECGIDPSTFLDQEDDKLDKIIARKYLKNFEEESFNRRKSKERNYIDKESKDIYERIKKRYHPRGSNVDYTIYGLFCFSAFLFLVFISFFHPGLKE